jgi:hypothetical protein
MKTLKTALENHACVTPFLCSMFWVLGDVESFSKTSNVFSIPLCSPTPFLGGLALKEILWQKRYIYILISSPRLNSMRITYILTFKARKHKQMFLLQNIKNSGLNPQYDFFEENFFCKFKNWQLWSSKVDEKCEFWHFLFSTKFQV